MRVKGEERGGVRVTVGRVRERGGGAMDKSKGGGESTDIRVK